MSFVVWNILKTNRRAFFGGVNFGGVKRALRDGHLGLDGTKSGVIICVIVTLISIVSLEFPSPWQSKYFDFVFAGSFRRPDSRIRRLPSSIPV